MSELPRSVVDALGESAAGERAPHVDAVDLAEYLDRVLGEVDRERVEAHLAVCASCRAVAAAAATHIALPSLPQPAGARSGRSGRARMRWLAAAAVGTVLAGVGWLSQTGDRLAELAVAGVAPEAASGLDAAHVRRARRALAGNWPDAGGFEAYEMARGGAALRSGEADSDPVLLAPRWFAVDTDRPLFRWRWEAATADRFEVLVVDAEEQPVAFFEIDASSLEEDPASPSVRALRLPDDQPALARGGTYAWKVNVLVNGDWLASDYVPFRVLSAEDSERLVADLEAAGGVPFLRALVLAEAGLDDQALDALGRAAAAAGDLDLAATGLLARRRLPAGEAERELDRSRQR